MTEVLSKKVRNDLVDAYALAEQVRLGGTPETWLSNDADLQTARYCSRFARDLAKQVNHKKNQLRSTLRAYNPVLEQVFPKNQLHHPAVYALLEHYVFPPEFRPSGRGGHHPRSWSSIATPLLGKSRPSHWLSCVLSNWFAQLARKSFTRAFASCVRTSKRSNAVRKLFSKPGMHFIQDRPETKLLYRTMGAGLSNTLALVSEVGDVSRFPDGDHLASFLGITTSKHISGTSIFHAKHITKQGSPNARYAIVNLAQHLCRRVPKYQAMYQRVKERKPGRIGHMIAVVAVARDFATNILYDMWHNQRPFFLEVAVYRKYRQEHPKSPA